MTHSRLLLKIKGLSEAKVDKIKEGNAVTKDNEHSVVKRYMDIRTFP